MNKTQQSKITYNKKAQDYDNTPEGRFTLLFKHQIVNAVKVKPGANVLDVACGNGTLLAMLGGKTKINGYGVDISENMIAEAIKLHHIFNISCPAVRSYLLMITTLMLSPYRHHFTILNSLTFS